MTRFRVTLNEKAYEVVLESFEDIKKSAKRLVPTAALPLETAAMSFGPVPHVLVAASKLPGGAHLETGTILSPLAGKLVSIDVQVGETVAAGAQVATIEAMKMNTYIFAPTAGKVTSVDARSGDVVEEGAVLLRINDASQPKA